jgi:bacteriocin-type transport-associated protein
MTTTLLQEMSNADIEWLLAHGQLKELPATQNLIHLGQSYEQTNILLDGILTISMPDQDETGLKELTCLEVGDMVGFIPSLSNRYADVSVQAQAPSLIVTIDARQLTEKLTQDAEFAAHFYRTQATLMMRRIQNLTTKNDIPPAILYKLNAKASSSLFTELQDQDLDWFVAVGEQRYLSEQAMLHHANRPIEALSIILDGALSLSRIPDDHNDITQVFRAKPPEQQQELTRLAKGDLFGEMAFISAGASAMSVQTIQVQAVRDTELLAIPTWRLSSRLLHDAAFALRFYRTLAWLLTNKYQTLVSKLGFLTHQDHQEFGDRFLAKVSMAEARFDFLNRRLQTKSAVERVM